jgi:hypothetical protein
MARLAYFNNQSGLGNQAALLIFRMPLRSGAKGIQVQADPMDILRRQMRACFRQAHNDGPLVSERLFEPGQWLSPLVVIRRRAEQLPSGPPADRESG